MAERARVAVLISGRGTNMAALIYAAKAEDCPFEVVLVSGDRPDAAGFDLAEAEEVAVVRLPRPTGKDKSSFYISLQTALAEARIDLVVLAGFMRILPDDFVARWEGRMINIHPSLLPKYRGLDTHAAALAAGDRVAGCTVHLVIPELDAGPILAQTEVAVMPGDTVETLAERVRIAEHQLLPRTLAQFASRPFDAAWIEQQVDRLANRLAEVTRGTSHGAPGWKVGGDKNGKLFAIIADRHHGEDSVGLLLKADGPDEMHALIEAHPDLYYWPKYYGASGWLGLRLSRRDVDWDHVASWLDRSWTAAAPPRLTKLMRVADTF